jgi:hypothetical protein
MNIPAINIQLTSFNGRGELYVSTKVRNPQYGMADVIQANSISFINNVMINITTNTVVYIGVYAATLT